jgi:hypothetical protein
VDATLVAVLGIVIVHLQALGAPDRLIRVGCVRGSWRKAGPTLIAELGIVIVVPVAEWADDVLVWVLVVRYRGIGRLVHLGLESVSTT